MRALLISFIALTCFLFPASAQELSRILEAHYKAASQEKMGKIETIITTGITSYAMAGFESGIKIYLSRPDKLRVEGDYHGSKVIETYNGLYAWKYAPAMGVPLPVKITGEEKDELLSLIQFENPLWHYAEKGAGIEVVGSEEQATIHLIYIDAGGEKLHFYIDRESHLITSIKTIQLSGGSERETEIEMQRYKKVKGIPFARRVTTRINGQVVTTLNIGKVELNRDIDPELFEKPSVE